LHCLLPGLQTPPHCGAGGPGKHTNAHAEPLFHAPSASQICNELPTH
jgi:hypothetical protein